MCCSLFNKVGGLKACTFIKKRLQQSCFPREYSKILKTTCFRKHLLGTTSTIEQVSKNFALLTGKHLRLLRRCFPVNITIGRNTSSACFCNLPLTHFMPLISFDTPENIRKTEFFWCFQGVSKEIIGMKRVNCSSYKSFNFDTVVLSKSQKLNRFN